MLVTLFSLLDFKRGFIMLKTVSSITNAIGALNYKGTWNASTNTPALASGVGTKGDYYVVSVAGSTNLDGETLWGVGDWAVYNGAAWQKVEGGNTINATTVSASTSVTTPVIQATSSAGGTLKNNSGTAQLQWGSGGGSNLSLEVATNINPANAAVNISPTGTGTVTINPATASTMNNVAIGGTTPLAGTFTNLTTTGNTILGNASTDTLNVGNGDLVKDASGNVGIGVTSDVGRLHVRRDSTTLPVVQLQNESATGQMMTFRTNGNSQVGSISYTVGGTSYNTSSDYRLKEAVQPMTGALAKVALLKPSIYKWKVDGSDGQGFIAHELQAIVPECVSGEKDALDAEGNPQYQGIDTSFLVATLTAAIQELKAIVDAQGAEIAKLKGATA
jgi:hypothetical protein